MKDFDVSLIGHLSFDRIFDGFEQIDSVGCIANVWHHLVTLDPSLKINLSPICLGEAIIYVDKKQAKRASVANLNLKVKKCFSAPSSNWHHILYLNCLPDTGWINSIPEDEIVSADVCKGEKLNIDSISRLDYLFISDEDMFWPIEILSSKIRGWVIMHHKSGSVCSNGEDSFELNIKPLPRVNVLGAGDMFAGSVIRHMLSNPKTSIKNAVKKSHKEVKKCLIKK